MTAAALCAGVLLCAASILNYVHSGKMSITSQSYRGVSVIYVLITVLAAVAVRYFQQAMPDALAIGAFLKFTASLPGVLFALKGYQLHKSRFSLFILVAIVMGLIADVSINLSFVVGGAVFLAGHLLYDVAFVHEQKPSRSQVILWLVLSALAVIPLWLFREKIGSLPLAAGAFIYISILISTIVFSWHLDKLIFAAAVVFACSDGFMVYNMITDGTMIMKILALLVYYGALLMYGAVLWKRSE